MSPVISKIYSDSFVFEAWNVEVFYYSFQSVSARMLLTVCMDIPWPFLFEDVLKTLTNGQKRSGTVTG